MIRMLRKIANRLFANLFRQFNRQNFFIFLNRNPRITNESVEIRDSIFNFFNPLGVDRAPNGVIFQRSDGVRSGNEHFGVVVCRALVSERFQMRKRFSSKGILLIQNRPPKQSPTHPRERGAELNSQAISKYVVIFPRTRCMKPSYSYQTRYSSN